MDPFILGVIVFFSFGLLFALGLWKTRRRVHARMELTHLRFRLRDVKRGETWMEETLTGWRDITWVQLVGRIWGSTDVHAAINGELPSQLSLTPQRGKSLGAGTQDIQIGVADLDAGFQVQCANPAGAIRFLRDERVRSALRGLLKNAPDAVVSQGEVRLTFSPFEDLSQFEQKAQAVIQCAQQLTEVVKPAVPEAPSSPAETPAAAAAVAASPVLIVQRSPEYLQRMRLEYGQRRLWLWYVYGGAFAMFVLVSLGWAGVLKGMVPFGRHSSGWKVVWGLTIVAVGCLRWILSRCPSCSTRLYGQVHESDSERHVIRLWSKHVTCAGCGIQLR